MTYLSRGLITLFLPLALAACGGDSHETLANASADLMEEMVGVLEGIEDKASAEAAKPKLEALAQRMEDLKKRVDAIGEPDAETKAALEAKLQSRMQPLTQKMMPLMMKLGQMPGVGDVLQDVMGKMPRD